MADTATAALEENSATVNGIFFVLMGDPYTIPMKDMQTTSFQINPEYNYTQAPPQLVGYSVVNSVSVTVRNLGVLGQLLDAIVAAGANQVNGVSFGFNNATTLTRTAQRNAVKDAQNRATLYANSAEVTLGAVLSIQEPGAVQYSSENGFQQKPADMAPVPIATGEQEISASIQVVYEIVS